MQHTIHKRVKLELSMSRSQVKVTNQHGEDSGDEGDTPAENVESCRDKECEFGKDVDGAKV